MALVIILPELQKEIFKKFKEESKIIFKLFNTLKNNPKNGKSVGIINNIEIKELKYKKFRFYFIVDGFKIRVLSVKELEEELITFIRMSEKKDQQKTIEEIKKLAIDFKDKSF